MYVCGKAGKDKFLKISLKNSNTHITKGRFFNNACAFFLVCAMDSFTLCILNIFSFYFDYLRFQGIVSDAPSLHPLEGTRWRVSYPVSLFTMVKRTNPNDSRGIRAVGAGVPISPI